VAAYIEGDEHPLVDGIEGNFCFSHEQDSEQIAT